MIQFLANQFLAHAVHEKSSPLGPNPQKDTVPEYLARRQVAAQQKLRPKVDVSREEFGGDFGGIRGGEKVHGFYRTFRCQRSIDILLGIGILVRLAAKQSGALQLENLKFKVLLSAADENLEKLSSNSSGKSRRGMRCGKVKEQHLHAGPFLPSLSPIEETVPRSELTGYDWFILMRKKMTHWRKAHLIPPHLNHSLSP
ncbi:hypothetical protein pipiens_018309 [Culex pipiens pipiens]|uniref:Uncharacterized protein n=1 Tax=Culex pipiens pipiens TaxID=38569 RepID=A0ABD1CCH8_CULPP